MLDNTTRPLAALIPPKSLLCKCCLCIYTIHSVNRATQQNSYSINHLLGTVTITVGRIHKN